MNRAWIKGLTLAGVVGSGGAAFAGVAAIQAADAATQPAATSTGDPARTVAYQVGEAGSVTIVATDDAISVAASTAGAGWTVVDTAATGAHVEVQFTDTLRIVTFAADLEDHEIVVSLLSSAAPGAPATTAPGATMDVTVITGVPGTTAPMPQPATPAPAPTSPPAANTPAPAATTAPSSGGDDDEDDEDEDEDDHEEDRGDDGEHDDD